MEIRVILRGALSGFVAGVLGFVFARIFAEPVIFSRTIQSTIGIATGIIAFSTAMGALVAVAYLVMHGRFNVRPRNLAWMIAGFGFLGVYLLPFVKYPANPPAIGHTFTITTRGHLYLTMVASALAFGALLDRYLTPAQPKAMTEPAAREPART